MNLHWYLQPVPFYPPGEDYPGRVRRTHTTNPVGNHAGASFILYALVILLTFLAESYRPDRQVHQPYFKSVLWGFFPCHSDFPCHPRLPQSLTC